MKPHQERVVTEKNELDEKRRKLFHFIGGDIYRTLDHVEQSRLNRQLDTMTLYSNILGERIAAFKYDGRGADQECEGDEMNQERTPTMTPKDKLLAYMLGWRKGAGGGVVDDKRMNDDYYRAGFKDGKVAAESTYKRASEIIGAELSPLRTEEKQ